ncbi:MAG: hypothetical protein ACI30B_00225 [Paludibacteraceae bacterium]
MKRIQAIGILAFLFTLVGCDKYNDKLLTDAEVEEYGYISPIIKDDGYPLSDMNYTHTLNFYLPLVYENESFEAQFVHIKGLQYDDVLTKEWQSKRIRVTSIEKMESLPFKRLPAIDYYPFMEQDSYEIISRQEDVDSIINKLEPITDYMIFPQNISEWQNIDFEKYYLIVFRSFVDFYNNDITNENAYNRIYNNLVFPFIIDSNNQVECFIFTQEIIYYGNKWLDDYFSFLLGILVEKDIKVDKVTFKHLKNIHKSVLIY